MYHWVIQVHKGSYAAVGPFKSEDACHRRYDKTKGGEIHEFRSQSAIAEEVIDEFKSDMAGGRI